MAQTNRMSADNAEHAMERTAEMPLGIKRSFTLPDGTELEVKFPRRHTQPSDMDAAKLLRFDQHLVHTFLAPFAKKQIADKTTPTEEQVQAAWLAFELGAARAVGTGQTIRERAAAEVATQLLHAQKGANVTFTKGDKGKTSERILTAIDDGSASERTKTLFETSLAKLRTEAEAKRGTATKKESVAGETLAI